jgi:hypothetical protein
MKALSLSLVLLVLLTPLDDALALATPGADDDAVAAQNNDYLTETARQVTVFQRDPAPLPRGDQTRAAVPGALPRPWTRQAGTLLATRPGSQLCYVLMSLLR